MPARTPHAASMWAFATAVAEQASIGDALCVFLTSIDFHTAVFLVSGGAQWKRQVERHRCHALCLWQKGQAGNPLSATPSTCPSHYVLSGGFDAVISMHCDACAQLRLNKVSELIHNSEHHRNLDSAQVSVYFQEIIDQVCAHAKRTLCTKHAWPGVAPRLDARPLLHA